MSRHTFVIILALILLVALVLYNVTLSAESSEIDLDQQLAPNIRFRV